MTPSPRILAVALVSLGGGCAAPGLPYDLAPVPRAGDGAAPVKAQVRRIAWSGQPESAELASEAHVAVEVDLHNADAHRAFAVGPLRLVARPALGGPAIVLPPAPPGDEIGLGPYRDSDELPPASAAKLAPHETRTVWATFVVPENEEPRGVMRLVVIVPVEGQPALEVAIADPVPGGPRWRPSRGSRPPWGFYVATGYTFLSGTSRVQAMEPIGLAVRTSFGRWVLGFSESYSYIYQEALAGGPPASGLSLMTQLTWHPWRWSLAPYVEGGAFLGFQDAPRAYGAQSHGVALPRVGAGILLTFGSRRLGPSAALPFERPLSPQRLFGLRVGYARWFNLAERGGIGGLQFSVELGGVP